MRLNHNRTGSSRAKPAGWMRWLALVGLVFLLAGCATAAPQVSPTETQAAAPTQAPTETPLPSATPTTAPTETPLPTVEPTATDLPTATPVPPLSVLDKGLTAWCVPESYAGTMPAGPDAPQDARLLTTKGETLQVGIPAAYCVIEVQFNQVAPEGAQVLMYDSDTAVEPFLKLPLAAAADRPALSWTSVSHPYVVNPPYWEITYRIDVAGPDGQALWSNPVKFAKPLPPECPYGGLPDPVTLWCAVTDPWEIEPWPDVEYPYDRSKLPTSEP